jgi:Family of unknown function (DUF6338)
MADLPSAANIKEIVSLFAPGMLILWPMSRVRIGPIPEFRERLIAYAIASTGYFAAISPICHYAVVPLLIGWLIAFMLQKGLDYRIAKSLKLEFFHHIPAAWDYTFSQMQPNTYVLATLKDGSRVGGIMGSDSFASSSKDERDLLIEDIWTIDPKEGWQQADPPRSALLVGNEIHYIEFFRSDGGVND